jgi:2,4-diaminopentanoate dehydrogenase
MSRNVSNAYYARTMTDPKYRVIVWGPGHIGAAALRELIQRPEFEVVGVKVYSDSKHGVDAGTLVGLEPIGIPATTRRDDILALDADCVVFTPRPLDAEANDRDAIDILRSGKNVVTTWNYHYPPMRGGGLGDRLEEACRAGGVTVHGTGVHPSFMVERLVITLTGLLLDVEHLRFVEAVDVSGALAGMGTEIVTGVGFGRDPAAFGPDDIGTLLAGPYYRDVIGYVGKKLFGADPDEIRIEHEFTGAPAACDMDLGWLRITKGTAATISHVHRGFIGDHHFFTNEEHWYLGPDERYLGTGKVPFGGFEGSSNYIVEIDGRPGRISLQMDMEATVPGDTPVITWCSVVPLIQAIIPVCHAEPGVLHPDARPHFARDLRTLVNAEPSPKCV